MSLAGAAISWRVTFRAELVGRGGTSFATIGDLCREIARAARSSAVAPKRDG